MPDPDPETLPPGTTIDLAHPPSTAVSEPTQTSGQPISRPNTRRRPRTGVSRRPPTVRPDTSASGIGELPDQQFFPEGEEFDEDDEDYESEEDEEIQETFAFHRPQTAAVPVVAFSETNTSAPNTGIAPTTAGRTSLSGASGGGGGRGGGGLRAVLSGEPLSPELQPTGQVEIGSYIQQPVYDPRHPPPMSGRNNPNNSAFAFSINRRRSSADSTNMPPTTTATQTATTNTRPPTGRSIFDRLQRRNLNTASTAMSGTTNMTTTTDASHMSFDSMTDDAGSFTESGTSGRRHPRKMRSKAPLIDGSEYTSSDAGTRRGMSRGSYGLTEFSGDMTVADGKTTWGDGAGGIRPIEVSKDGSEEGSIGAGLDIDLLEEDSPYPEVRASVSNIDDPEMPALTLRAFILGILFVTVCSALNTFFMFRFPSPSITALIVEIVVYPFGRLAAAIAPINTWTLPRWLGGKSFSFNPGPFNVKEHALIVIMANVGLSQVGGLHLIVSGQLFYGRRFEFGFAFLFILCTQLLGFSMAGLARRYVVWPASMIWPEALVVATNLNAFHAEEDAFQGGMSRIKFLVIVLSGAAFYYWLPGFLFTALGWFSWVCWIAPRNKVVNQLFGVNMGLGMGIFTFDWSQITWISNPLVIPWWAQVNVAVAFVLFYWILTPIIYYTNTWYTAYLPINTQQSADRFGSPYDVSLILGPDMDLNTTAYAEYSPVYLSACLNVTYTIAYALTTAVVVHALLWHGPRLWHGIRNVKTEVPDIHLKLIKQYPEVPDWWYGIVFVVLFSLAIVCIEVFETNLPVWAFVIALLLALVYFLPTAIIYATTVQLMTINLIAELIPGFMLPGRPIAVMMCKVFSMQVLSQGVIFTQDQKLGHYMKIPPRSTFFAQFAASFVACLVTVGTKTILFETVEGICDDGRSDHLTCDITKTFFTSTVLWGLIGPARLYAADAFFHPQVYAAIAGAVLPVLLFLLVRRYPQSWLRNINIPVFLNGPLNVPPATGMNYGSFIVIGAIFQFYIRRRHFAWWSKYNYVLAAALDVGTALGVIMLWLCTSLPELTLDWWGNTVYQNTIDWSGEGAAFLDLPEAGFFGPDTWKV